MGFRAEKDWNVIGLAAVPEFTVLKTCSSVPMNERTCGSEPAVTICETVTLLALTEVTVVLAGTPGPMRSVPAVTLPNRDELVSVEVPFAAQEISWRRC